MKLAGVMSDMHIPYHDKKAVKLFLKIAKILGVDHLLQVGDLVDCYAISKYSKDPDRASGVNLQKEFDEAVAFLEECLDITPYVTVLEGNHEQRLMKYLKEKAPGLFGLRDLTIRRLLKINQLGVEYTTHKFLGQLYVFHGDQWTKSGSPHSSMTAKTNVERSGLNVMHGHIHRMGEYHVTKQGYELSGYEIGCLCETDVEYCHYPNWQLGGAFVTYEDAGNKDFFVEKLEIEKVGKDKKSRRAFFRGKIYIEE